MLAWTQRMQIPFLSVTKIGDSTYKQTKKHAYLYNTKKRNSHSLRFDRLNIFLVIREITNNIHVDIYHVEYLDSLLSVIFRKVAQFY